MDRLTETNGCIGFMETYLKTDCEECQYKNTAECQEFKDECAAVAKFKDFVKEMYSKLKELEVSEEQGKLLKLPCVVGDTLYSVSFRKKCREAKENNGYLVNSNIECIACEFSDCTCGSKQEYFIKEVKATLPMIATLIEQPKDIMLFLTREQAELALQGMKESEGEN